MYTFSKVLSDEKNLTTRRRIVVVEFINGEELLSQKFEFSLNTELGVIKRTIKSYLEELNFVTPAITDITVTPDAEPTPDPKETAKAAWLDNYQKLKAATQLNTMGVQVVTATQLAALQKRVKDDFLVEYADLVN